MISRLAPLGLVASLLLVTLSCRPAAEPADLVLSGGKIVTLDPTRPEAEALAAVGQRIVAVGSAEEIARYVGPATEVIDLAGATAVPGLIEGHGHFLGVGLARMQLDLRGAATWDDIVDQVAAAAAEAAPGQWIEGRGWHQEKWRETPEPQVDGLPYHHTLSAVSPDNPVVLRHASGHAAFANAKAMELGGVTADTPDPEGGTIVRGPDGEPIGAFLETAMGLVARRTPFTEVELRRMAALAGEEALSKGITSFQDAGSSVEEIRLFRALADEGALPVRLWVMIHDSNDAIRAALPEIRTVGYGDGFLTVRAIKHWIDGALGSHGAWLLEPYSDLASSTGLNTTPIGTLEESAEIALENDLQLCVHAIGDRANRETLDLFERAFSGRDGAALRWRIEHAQHLHPNDIPRFASLGVIASMQAVHCTSDGPWVLERLGEQRAREGAYVWRSLLDSGALVTNGTDAPVEDVDPLPSLYAAVSRRMANGEVFYPAQVMTRAEALASYTLSNARAAFEEQDKGSLEPGKLADVTVLDKDLTTVPEDEIPDARVLWTVVGGQVRYAGPTEG